MGTEGIGADVEEEDGVDGVEAGEAAAHEETERLAASCHEELPHTKQQMIPGLPKNLACLFCRRQGLGKHEVGDHWKGCKMMACLGSGLICAKKKRNRRVLVVFTYIILCLALHHNKDCSTVLGCTYCPTMADRDRATAWRAEG